MSLFLKKLSLQTLAVTVPACLLVATSLSVSAANLAWIGDGANNNWDAGTTVDWLNGGSPNVFHHGDNATFDDTGDPTSTSTALWCPVRSVVNANMNHYSPVKSPAI